MVEAPLWAALRDQLSDDPEWAPAFSGGAGLHVAVMTGPFLRFIFEGRKTVESRFSKNRVAPAGTLHEGDVIAFKTGPITAACLAGAVHAFTGVTPAKMEQIRRDFGPAICADDDDFWEAKAGSRFATLVEVLAVRKLANPVDFPKRDKRGWVTVTTRSDQPRLL